MKMIIVLVALWAATAQAAESAEWHTSPACWKSPRIYASAEPSFVNVALVRTDEFRKDDGMESPNGAYDFFIDGMDQDNSGAGSPTLFIDNERPYLLTVTFPETTSISAAEWINENLIYLRLWWGRESGADFIIDVEAEKIIHQQPIRYGSIAFQQFKQCEDPSLANSDQCQCLAKATTE